MSAAAAAGEREPAIPRSRFVAFFCMVFGMFMAILDIQIVSASLGEIQAGLGASADEIAWVQTSYLIAEVVMIPLSGFLSRALSTRWLFAGACAGFTAMSVLCATANSIDEMIVYRALQGFIGGGMIPTVFASAFIVFPPRLRPVMMPLIGLVATMAPTIGPTLGGYLTELFSWHWLFLINIVPGIIVTATTILLVDFDEPDLSLLRRFDFLGLACMACFLGSLEYVLEEGSREGWFDDDLIVGLFGLALVSGAAFFWRALTVAEPVVDLRAFTNRNFATGAIFSFVMGIGLYGLTYLYPVYLGRIRDYSSLQIGETMAVTGIAMFLTAPVAGRLMTRLDPRAMMAIGFSGFALGTWMASGLTKEWDFQELLLPQILRGCSLMLAMVPISNISLGTLPPAMIKNASGLFNLTRNLGGAVGLAIIGTLIDTRTDLHVARLNELVTWSRTAAVETLAGLTASLSALGSDAGTAALARLAAMVRREAAVMAFADVFLVLTGLFLMMLCALPFMQRPDPVASGGGGGH